MWRMCEDRAGTVLQGGQMAHAEMWERITGLPGGQQAASAGWKGYRGEGPEPRDQEFALILLNGRPLMNMRKFQALFSVAPAAALLWALLVSHLGVSDNLLIPLPASVLIPLQPYSTKAPYPQAF